METANFYITIKNGLIKDGHRQRMGSAVWEFMWILDKITKIDEDGMGWVLGGKSIKLSEIKKDLFTHETHISENLNKLKKEGYINLINSGHGLIIQVNKAFKRFSQKAKAGLAKRQKLVSEKAKPNIRQYNRQDSKTIIPLSSSPLEFLTEEICQKISERYRVKLSFVLMQREALRNYCEASGKTYRNYEAALRNFCLRDMKNISERRMGDPSKRVIDARNL